MAKKSTETSEYPVNDEVRRFLSANGKKGGATTRKLIELGKQAAEDTGEDVESEVMDELHRSERKKAS